MRTNSQVDRNSLHVAGYVDLWERELTEKQSNDCIDKNVANASLRVACTCALRAINGKGKAADLITGLPVEPEGIKLKSQHVLLNSW